MKRVSTMRTPTPARNGISIWKEVVIWGLVLGGIGWVHGHFLRAGHGWGDDFAQYLLHAKNLAEGRPYSQTGYLYNPQYPQLGPPAYPPGTALVLAPVYWGWGLDWGALKGIMILCLLIFLALLAGYFRQSLSLPQRVLVVVLIGLNHFFLDQTNAIGSDLPFLVWVYLALILAERADRTETTRSALPPAGPEVSPPSQEGFQPGEETSQAGDEASQPGEEASQPGEEAFQPGQEAFEVGSRSDVSKRGRGESTFGVGLWHWAAALAAGAAFATRTVGLVLWVAVILAEVLRHGRLRASLGWATGLFVLLVVAQSLWIPGTSGYLDQISFDPVLLATHTVQYARQLAAFWHNGFSKLLTAGMALAISILAVVGYLRQCRQRVSVREIFPLFYGAVVVVWPSYQGFRMLDPVIPLWLFYAWKGWESDWLQRSRRVRSTVAVGLVGVMAACYGSVLITRPTDPLPEGVGQPTSQELFQAVQQHTKPEDVLIFIKPRALALFTGRPCSVYHLVQKDTELWAYFHQIQTSFLVVVLRPEAMQGAENLERVQFLTHFVARNQQRLHLLWSNKDFALYRIQRMAKSGGLHRGTRSGKTEGREAIFGPLLLQALHKRSFLFWIWRGKSPHYAEAPTNCEVQKRRFPTGRAVR